MISIIFVPILIRKSNHENCEAQKSPYKPFHFAIGPSDRVISAAQVQVGVAIGLSFVLATHI